MTIEKIRASEDWKKCIKFHGHECPGIAIGFRAAKAGLDFLKEKKAPDEELVAIVESDACDADAIQVLTGCTFGKGNFIYKEYGKHAYTFFSRDSGKGFRVVLQPGILELGDRHRQLIQRMRSGVASREEQAEFEKLHARRVSEVLNKPLRQLFNIKEVHVPIPEKAQIVPSLTCDRCGEPTMSTRLKEVEGKRVCRGCRES